MKKRQGSEFDRFESNPLAQRFVGRVQTQAEQFAHLILGCSAEEFSSWLGAVLVRDGAPQQQLDVAALPSARLRRSQSAHVDKRLRKVAVGGHSHRRSARAARSAKVEVKRDARWRNKDGSLMNEKQRKAEAKRRADKWSVAAKAAWHGSRKAA